MAGRVFISHASADKPVARKIASELRNRGIDVWIDEKNVDVGSSIGEAVAEGIDSSDYFLILLSGKSVQSRWVHAEASMAFQKAMDGKFPIIPVRLDGTPVPKMIKHLKYIDYRAQDNRGLDEILSFFKVDERLASDRRRAKLSDEDDSATGDDCVSCLKGLTGKELRMKIIDRYDYSEIRTVWFDLFSSRIEDDIPHANLANAIIDLIEKAKKKSKFEELLATLCQEHPKICP